MSDTADSLFARRRKLTGAGPDTPVAQTGGGSSQVPRSRPAPAEAVRQDKDSEPARLTRSEAIDWSEADLQRTVNLMMLAHYRHPALIVDDALNMLQSRGDVGLFVKATSGNEGRHLLQYLREDLAGETSAALLRALRDNVPANATAVLSDPRQGKLQVRIDVLPITSAMDRARRFLILFEEAPNPSPWDAAREVAAPQRLRDDGERQIAQLRQDLASTRFHLQSLLEERNARQGEPLPGEEQRRAAGAASRDMHEAERAEAQERRELESEVEQASLKLDRNEKELRALMAKLFSVREEERQMMARELHDDIGQRLSALEILLSEVERSAGGQSSARIREGRSQLQSLSGDVRQLSHRLHPAVIETLGLSAALKSLVEEFGRQEGMPASFLPRNLPDLAAQPAATTIYRITQEALHNVAKHAGKTHVKVILEAKDRWLHLEIRDLGTGFDQNEQPDASRSGLGIISMRERARLAGGKFAVSSELGRGTCVTAEIPFNDGAEEHRS